MRSLWDTGAYTQRAWVERFGLSAGYVGHLLNRRWLYVPAEK